ncbi:MAG: hypothetical protein JSS64_06610 [Bacteroidetes bacterium]|nr:hypothetical protein [Bacteroidota bacterium]
MKLSNHFEPNKRNQLIRYSVVAITIFLFAFGIAQALFPIRPFWNDEWRLIYNIKFKSVPELWGRLDLLQECPRVYLTLLKYISATFDYSYIALRLPPLIISGISALFVFHLHHRIYPDRNLISYLFILILLSSQTFTDYMVQVKQYEMDILLSLLAIGQLLVLNQAIQDKLRRISYWLLSCSLLFVPFLSYIYPIVLAPIFVVISWKLWNEREKNRSFIQWAQIIFPLLLAVISILIFYAIDVKNVMGNKEMYISYQRAYYHSQKETLLGDLWNLFALVGSGFIFEIVFGIIGLSAFTFSLLQLSKIRWKQAHTADYIRLYAVLLLLLVMALLFTGKIIGGVARLTAYTVPSISILIIFLLDEIYNRFERKKISNGIAFVLFIALFGNIISSCINNFTYEKYHDYITTYRNTGKALRKARLQNIPFMVTDGVCGDDWKLNPDKPGHIQTNTISAEQIKGVDTLCAEVITKVHPEYKVWAPIVFYYMPDSKWIKTYVDQVPKQYRSVIAGDGIHFKTYIRTPL